MKNDKRMQIWLATTHSDEEGPPATKGKFVTIVANKKQVAELASYFGKVARYLKSNAYCHMHFRDYNKKWNKKDYIDIAVTVERRRRK